MHKNQFLFTHHIHIYLILDLLSSQKNYNIVTKPRNSPVLIDLFTQVRYGATCKEEDIVE